VTVKSAARGCQEWIPIKRWESPFDCIKWHKESHHPDGRPQGKHERRRRIRHYGILFAQ
jgi:hypothetical protein